MPRRRRDTTDPASHHGFLDDVDRPGDTKRKKRGQGDDEEEGLDLDRFF